MPFSLLFHIFVRITKKCGFGGENMIMFFLIRIIKSPVVYSQVNEEAA